MPKGRKNNKKKMKRVSPSNMASKAELVEDFLSKAEADVNIFSYEAAAKNCQNALSVDPKSIRATELLASVLIELQDIEQAESLYLKCIELCPDEGFEKYLSLGQLSEGKRALGFYQKGISIIEKMLEKTDDKNAGADSKGAPLCRILSDAHCSVAELYMTDLCDEDDAEVFCESVIDKSIKADALNPEAYQCLANLKLIQQKNEEAKSSILKSLSFWLPHSLDDDFGLETEHHIPEYESRIKASQLLIELSLFEEATQILERLLDENDEVFIVWYLLGWANYIHGDVYRENAYHYLEKAKLVSDKHGCDNEELLQHVDELIEELGAHVQSEVELPFGNVELVISSSESELEMDT